MIDLEKNSSKQKPQFKNKSAVDLNKTEQSKVSLFKKLMTFFKAVTLTTIVVIIVIIVWFFIKTDDKKMLDALKSKDAQALEQALIAGANPNIKTELGLFEMGSFYNHFSTEYDGKIDVTVRGYGTPLIDVVQKPQMVELLLKYGADVNGKNEYGTTALMEAALRNQISSLDLLLKQGADINATDNEGITALMIVISHSIEDIKWKRNPANNMATIKYLLEHGADPDIVNKKGGTAFTFAESEKRQDIIELLKSFQHKK